MTYDDLTRAHELRAEGQSISEIARYLNTTRNQVRRILRQEIRCGNGDLSVRERQRALSWPIYTGETNV